MAKKSTKRSEAEKKLLYQLETMELPAPDTEVTFSNDRGWRFDFAWSDIMLAIEIEGGTWVGSRHTQPKGFEESYNFV